MSTHPALSLADLGAGFHLVPLAETRVACAYRPHREPSYVRGRITRETDAMALQGCMILRTVLADLREGAPIVGQFYTLDHATMLPEGDA